MMLVWHRHAEEVINRKQELTAALVFALLLALLFMPFTLLLALLFVPAIIVDQTLENENHMLKKAKKNKSTMGVSLKQMQQVRLLPRFYSFEHVHIAKR